MKHDHMSPEEAVTAFLDLHARQFIPMHYGTFKLADDTPQEAIDRLQKAWGENQIPLEQLNIALLGETILPSIQSNKKEEAFF